MSDVNYIESIRSGDMGLVEVPRKSKTHSICLAAVNQNGLDLYHVPKYMRSETIHYAAVYENAKAIEFIDSDYLVHHQDLVTFAVSRKGQVLKWLLSEAPSLVTYDVCLKAVRSSGSSLAYVPESMLDESLIRVAVENDASALNVLFKYNADSVKRAIGNVINSIPLKHLPDHFKSYEICLNQVSEQGRQLRYVPFPLIDERMVEAALNSNPWAIEYVPITFSDDSTVTSLISGGTLPHHLYEHIEGGVEIVYD